MGHRKRTWKCTATLAATAALSAAAAQPAHAIPSCPDAKAPQVILDGQGTLESVIVDRKGRLIYSDITKRAFMIIDAPGATPRVLSGGIDGPGGLALDDQGFVIAGYGASIPNGVTGLLSRRAGLFRINPDTGERAVYARGLQMANGVARHPDGTVFASNDVGISLDRVAPDGKVQVSWASLVSANGLAVDSSGRYLFAAQTFQTAAVKRVEIATGNVSTYASAPLADLAAGLDGMTIDERDRLFVSANQAGEVWRVGTDRSMCALARGLPQTSAVNFGTAAPGAPGFPATSLYAVTFQGKIYEIPNARPAVAPPATRKALQVSVSPRRPRANRLVTLRMTVRSRAAGSRAALLPGARIAVGRRTVTTNRSGRATLRLRLRKGRTVLRVSAPGHRTARVTLTAV